MYKYKITGKRTKKGTVTADFMEDALHEVMRKHKGMKIISLNKIGNCTFKYKVEERASDSPFTLREVANLEERGWEILSIDKVDDFTEEQLNQIADDNDVYGYNQEQEVDSSWIKKINYNNNKKELEITTNSDFEYIYVDVPVRIFQDFLAAESAGRYFNKMIKGKFERKEG